MLERNEVIENRYQSLGKLREKGINPFPKRFVPTHKSNQIVEQCDQLMESKEIVTVAGRVLAIRDFGKTFFFHLLDGNGKVQVYVKKNYTTPESFELFSDFIGTGDIVGITGEIFRTKTNETTVAAKDIQLLTKSVRPLPEKWHGLRDKETRYRQRYVDLIVNEDVKETFVKRTKIINAMRHYLDEKEYLEVETPMLQVLYGGAVARPFFTHHNALDINLYMRIAPELYLKRLIVGGFEKVYEINRNFRNEGISHRHNPEFTMMELYTAYFDYNDTIALTEDLIKTIFKEVNGNSIIKFNNEEIDISEPWRQITVLDILKEDLGVELHWSEDVASVREKVQQFIHLEPSMLTQAQMIMYLFEEKIEKTLIKPTFILEYPTALSPLAKEKPEDPLVVERFELFINGIELANAYSELNDPEEQLKRFKQQLENRDAEMEGITPAIDEDYVRALEYGMPPVSGLGIGIDRLVMAMTHNESIRDVILFPLLRPEREQTEEEIEEQLEEQCKEEGNK